MTSTSSSPSPGPMREAMLETILLLARPAVAESDRRCLTSRRSLSAVSLGRPHSRSVPLTSRRCYRAARLPERGVAARPPAPGSGRRAPGGGSGGRTVRRGQRLTAASSGMPLEKAFPARLRRDGQEQGAVGLRGRHHHGAVAQLRPADPGHRDGKGRDVEMDDMTVQGMSASGVRCQASGVGICRIWR